LQDNVTKMTIINFSLLQNTTISRHIYLIVTIILVL